jgi:hypothetical protein
MKAQSNLSLLSNAIVHGVRLRESIMSEIVFFSLLNKCLSMDLFLSNGIRRRDENLLSINIPSH